VLKIDVTFRVTCGFYYISSESPGTFDGRARRTVSQTSGIPATTINAELAEPAETRGVRLQADFSQSG
jgi:hypothetical protein